MSKSKVINFTIVFILIGVLLVGCISNGNEGNTFSIASVDAEPLMPPFGKLDVAVNGVNDFAFRLSAVLAERNGDNNLICSPFSVWLPLVALINATYDAERDALLAALSLVEIDTEEINKAASRLLYDLTKQYRTKDGLYSPLQIVNAVFMDNNLTIKQEFAQLFADYYRGASINANFRSLDAVRAVNQWASDSTNGLISEIIHSFDPNTVTVIADAIYFSGQWREGFNPDDTKEDIFHSPTGDETAHFMLREYDRHTYYVDEKVQAMPLEFTTGGGLYIILPKDGDATGLLSSLTTEYFNEIIACSERVTGRLLLPRFSIDSGVMQLSDMLSELGVTLFDKSSAPLTGGIVEEDIPMWLSGVMQRAFITVDEEGATAAAVTVISAPGEVLVEPTVPFEMKCDRPFVFVLYADTTDGRILLFTGIVNHIQ